MFPDSDPRNRVVGDEPTIVRARQVNLLSADLLFHVPLSQKALKYGCWQLVDEFQQLFVIESRNLFVCVVGFFWPTFSLTSNLFSHVLRLSFVYRIFADEQEAPAHNRPVHQARSG